MEYTLDQILDVKLLQDLQDKLNAINPYPSALIDNSGKILTATAWQDICTKFHRINPEAEKECILSDQYIVSHLDEAKPAVTYVCPHGLVDNAIPIIVEGKHLANFFTGQFFLKPPDIEFFRKQAIRYGFNETDYLEAVKRVPVWSMDQVHSFLDFNKLFIESLATMGLARLRESEANRLLDEKEFRYRSIIEDTQAGYFSIDPAGIVLDVNDSWVRMNRYGSREEIIGHPIEEVQQMDEVGKSRNMFERIMAGDPEFLSGEFCQIHRDGSIGYNSYTASPVLAGDKIVGIEGFVIDITPQKLAEKDRDISRTRLKSVFDSMVEGFALHEIICDEEGNPADYIFLEANPAFEKLTGMVADDIRGKRARDVFTNLEPSWIERYGRVALTGEPDSFEMYNAQLDRYYRVVAFSNEKGQFATIFDDITERKITEDKVRTLAHAIDCINECVSMTDSKNTIIFVNKAFCNTYGYSVEELLGQNIAIVRSPDDMKRPSTDILNETLGGGWSGEVVNRKKDGTEFPAHISTAIVFDDDNRPIALIGIAIDITERKKSEQELIAAKEQAEESDRLKSAFLANISHEIRTPMNSILGFSELLVEIVKDPVQLKYLKVIMTGGERLLNIINSVIDIAKIEAGQENLVPVEFDVNPLMQELYDLNKQRNPGIAFVNETEGYLPLILFMDKTKLFQILNNLVTNALKYTKEGSVRFGYQLVDDQILYHVKDTGIGIPPAFKTKVFERFRKAEFEERADFEGTGLGLAITLELVKMMQGEIWFDSEPGGGTTFYVRLPVIVR